VTILALASPKTTKQKIRSSGRFSTDQSPDHLAGSLQINLQIIWQVLYRSISRSSGRFSTDQSPDHLAGSLQINLQIIWQVLYRSISRSSGRFSTDQSPDHLAGSLQIIACNIERRAYIGLNGNEKIGIGNVYSHYPRRTGFQADLPLSWRGAYLCCRSSQERVVGFNNPGIK